jgi:choline transport protein
MVQAGWANVNAEAGWATICVAGYHHVFDLLMGGQPQETIFFLNSIYVTGRWHATLIMWLVVLLAWAQNVWGVILLPTLKLFARGLRVLVFFVFCIVMLAMSRNASADFVFTGFIGEIGWNNNHVA